MMLQILSTITLLACSGSTSDTGLSDAGPGTWSECADEEPKLTCNEVCADEGRVCAPRACDGDTMMRFHYPTCRPEDGEGEDIGCTSEFDVETTMFHAVRCCCW